MEVSEVRLRPVRAPRLPKTTGPEYGSGPKPGWVLGPDPSLDMREKTQTFLKRTQNISYYIHIFELKSFLHRLHTYLYIMHTTYIYIYKSFLMLHTYLNTTYISESSSYYTSIIYLQSYLLYVCFTIRPWFYIMHVYMNT